eukprot:CAMPEP_0181365568 /NCGR_PEP_ID=MMETSP1106-20121128/10149_1 /TAXON_ID=81844 /ORGANISM="Mantoniella antarctica, Strain SL-175" /LENGTH=277 /DNA_ID=CAMNT_0023480677 /DNA_START=57 /DNA_END=890 /DNA_ORIENTATION=-
MASGSSALGLAAASTATAPLGRPSSMRRGGGVSSKLHAPTPPPRQRVVAGSGELGWDEADGEFMHLEIGNEKADIFMEVLDRYTAQVKVTAPDRPGMLQDVCTALTGNKFSIDSAEISTGDDTADGRFVIKLAEGGDDTFEDKNCFYTPEGEVCQTMLEKVKGLIVEAAINSWSISTPADLAYIAPEDQVVQTDVAVMEVETSLRLNGGKCMMVTVTATDRPGLLAATTAALQRVGAKVISASVTTTDGAADNKFVIAALDGCSAEQVRAACVDALK